MDYLKLITAIKNGKQKELDTLYTEAFDILCGYLRSTMRANLPDAEDCAQHAIMMTIKRIQNNAIKEPESIYSYLIQSAKNRYLRVRFENNRSNYQDNMEPYIPVEEQTDYLVTEEEQLALENCLEKLPSDSKSFIDFWLTYPNSQARDVAEKFGISVNNVWIKKHRIIKKLTDCIEKKIGE
ncbi:MAG: sigma-70 family RNA polymerase sigma factor [Balneolales bacterium]